MRKILTLFLSIAFIFGLFAIFDIQTFASGVNQSVTEQSAKYNPVIAPAQINFGNRPRAVGYSVYVVERTAKPAVPNLRHKTKKYGFRLSHKNFYPPEKRVTSRKK